MAATREEYLRHLRKTVELVEILKAKNAAPQLGVIDSRVEEEKRAEAWEGIRKWDAKRANKTDEEYARNAKAMLHKLRDAATEQYRIFAEKANELYGSKLRRRLAHASDQPAEQRANVEYIIRILAQPPANVQEYLRLEKIVSKLHGVEAKRQSAAASSQASGSVVSAVAPSAAPQPPPLTTNVSSRSSSSSSSDSAAPPAAPAPVKVQPPKRKRTVDDDWAILKVCADMEAASALVRGSIRTELARARAETRAWLPST